MNGVEMGHLEVLQGGVCGLLVARDPKDNVHITSWSPSTLSSLLQKAGNLCHKLTPHKFTSYWVLGKVE